ncbi:hypothetical protein [Nesterenkonia jeotgali]|uniref:Small-conductance mechanosensitive channel n=1 Tax=Nesterenkonia jeotgali TaxID=317018 RepID=A0A839FL49_9MICC|nr:hypothetical protein [Nesterenkonia jeotgali]MBA8922410.1 small-conductance mechanosensitive channel [Nesterenkonia jeotgali]
MLKSQYRTYPMKLLHLAVTGPLLLVLLGLFFPIFTDTNAPVPDEMGVFRVVLTEITFFAAAGLVLSHYLYLAVTVTGRTAFGVAAVWVGVLLMTTALLLLWMNISASLVEGWLRSTSLLGLLVGGGIMVSMLRTAGPHRGSDGPSVPAPVAPRPLPQ